MENEKPKKVLLYDGKDFCCTDKCCPEVELKGDNIIISDPSKPEKGEFIFTKEEYNLFLKNAKTA